MSEYPKKEKKDSILGENMPGNFKNIKDKEDFLDLLSINPALEIKVPLSYNNWARHLISKEKGWYIVDYSYVDGATIKYEDSSFWDTPVGVSIDMGKVYIIGAGS